MGADDTEISAAAGFHSGKSRVHRRKERADGARASSPPGIHGARAPRPPAPALAERGGS